MRTVSFTDIFIQGTTLNATLLHLSGGSIFLSKN